MRLALVAALALMLAAPAGAQTIPAEQLDAVDADSDGAVSLEELTSVMASAFEGLDANGNGYIEWSEAQGTLTAEHFGSADTDGNNGISEAEFMAQVERDFAAADQDGDGTLD